MFKGRKIWAFMMLLVLLMGILAPLEAGAQSSVPTGTLEVTADLHPDGYGQIYFSPSALRSLGSSPSDIWATIAGAPENYQFQWSACDGANQSAIYAWGDANGNVSYHDKESSLKAMVQKNLLFCNISQNGLPVATVILKLKSCLHVPTQSPDDIPLSEYVVYFDVGKPLTIQMRTKLEIGGGESIWYKFSKYEKSEAYEGYEAWYQEEVLDERMTEASITFTPTAEDHGKRIMLEAATKGYDNWRQAEWYLLLDRAKEPIKIPVLEENAKEIGLKAGESKLLTLPVATAEDASKELEYRWYRMDKINGDNINKKLVQTSSYPSLTVKAEDQGYYKCWVGYKGSDESSFLEYGCYFFIYLDDAGQQPVNPSTPGAITVPSVENDTPHYSVKNGERITLSVPAASGDSSKTLMYNWYSSTDGTNYVLLKSTITPEVTISNSGKESGNVYYTCKVGYPETDYKNFDAYEVVFTVNFGGVSEDNGSESAASAVPKTGDNTPLTAMIILLSIAFASGIMLIGIHYKHSHS